MKEKLYTIPVHDAFQEECECPVCSMYRSIEQDALRFTMSGYMVEERRMESNRVGFCERHMKMLYEGEDRLGLAWMIKTHMEHIIGEIEKRQEAPVKQASFFKKKAEPSELTSYLEFLDHSCFVCDKINAMFERYLVTIFYLYKKEEAFRGLFRKSKGFCTEHYRMLAEMAPAQLGGELLQQFMKYAGLDEETAVKAVEYYRERYTDIGIFENEVYPGVEDMLDKLRGKGYILAVASSKPERFVKKVLDHFDLTKYFQEIVGSEMNGGRTSKADVIEEALDRLHMADHREQVVMVGDKEHDVFGARKAGLKCLAVSYGYGSEEELKNANPLKIVDSAQEVLDFFS